jgi:hypothetical protein
VQELTFCENDRFDCIKRTLRPKCRTGVDVSAECQVDEPCNEQNGDGENGENDEGDSGEKEPVAPVVAMRLLQVLGEQGVVAAIGLPCDVEGVSEEGHGADDDIEREIDQHARDGDVSRAAHPGGKDDDAGCEAGKDVADAGDEADDAVQAEADGGSRDAEPGVEQAAEQVEIFVAEEAVVRADTRVGRQDLGFALCGHAMRL